MVGQGKEFMFAPRTKRRPVYQAETAPTVDLHTAFGHTLSIMTAATEDEILARTLTAACEVTSASVDGAVVAVALTGPPVMRGDPVLAGRLASTAGVVNRRRTGGLTGAYAGIGLPCAITLPMGEIPIIVACTEPDAFTTEHGSVLALLVAHALAARERLREVAALAQQADSDPLTGLRHQRPFEERLRSSRPGQTAILTVDVDEFKKINDSHGHQAGDLALLSLVGALRGSLRDQDQLYRIGGDEFAVVLDVKEPTEIVTVARRLLDAARRVGQTISIGAALRSATETGRETLQRADQALYQAKRAGRDTARLAT
jgi:diguanylate cyclase (GGDEF)-like protein